MTEERLKELLAEAVAQAAIQPELLMLKDVAAMLNISLPSARKLRDTGAIPFYLLAGQKLFKRKDVEAFIDGLKPEGRNKNGVA